MDNPKKVKDLSVDELKEIIKEALVETLGIKGIEKASTENKNNLLEEEFPLVWVRGEVSNISRPSSGHIYFSLKDKDSLLSVVWFKSNHFLSSGLLPEKLYNGQEIICAGHISVYPVKGIYQLIAEHVEDVGVGNLYLEFEALKKKLASKGYFDELRKRPIPKNPKRVGVITAPTGAAIRDFLKIAREKGMPSHIRIYPSTVQGEEAESKIVKMLEEANKEGWAEVLAIIRGGGSFEDLFIFNSETIATAIYKSKIPVITGIGHEIDFTIADMWLILGVLLQHKLQLFYGKISNSMFNT